MKIRTETGAAGVAAGETINKALLSSLAAKNAQSHNAEIVLSIRDDSGAIIAGITASTAYGWLLIKTLWVHEDRRGKGFGCQLMGAVEVRGRELGCHGAWLDTSDPDAKAFYEAQGFESFGELSKSPEQFLPEHRRWFMKRRL